ncbi:MAG TPA: glutathione S-transferase family protein [Pseudomonadales bacterium]|nr:glutathione S-transferase family protein [Pseudomonadales bacterium]
MALKIYGVAASRTVRTLWMAEELGIEYEHVPVHFSGDAQQPEFLARNPNGRVPVIDDDGLVVWESMAINLHLAETRGGPLAPASAAERAGALQWSFWVMTECEKPLLNAYVNAIGLFGVEQDAEQVRQYMARLERPLTVLDGWLAGRSWLIADRFTVADLNVAGVLMWIRDGRLDISAYGRLNAWLERCGARPALERARSA